MTIVSLLLSERNTLSPIRDPKDLYLLTLAETIDAAYIVSGDKDLLELQHHKQTKIIKLADFRNMMQQERL